MIRFSIRDLLWLTLVVAMGLGWFAHQRQLRVDADARLQKANEQFRKAAEERFLAKLSPAQKKFYALCKSVNKGMSEQEVDSLLSGHSKRPGNISGIEPEYLRLYDEGASEGEYALVVTFDEEHRVVSAFFTEYVK